MREREREGERKKNSHRERKVGLRDRIDKRRREKESQRDAGRGGMRERVATQKEVRH